jgi:hypothetical protein
MKLTERTTGASDAPQDVAASVLRRYRFMEIGNVHGRMETYVAGLEQQWLQMPFFPNKRIYHFSMYGLMSSSFVKHVLGCVCKYQ